MKKYKIYIASPYTKGDTAINVRKSFEAYYELLNKGFLPFSPLTTHFIHMMFPQEYGTWLEIDIEWLKVCDCALRLPGESKGADIEVEEAKLKDIPVFYTIGDLLIWVNNKNAIKHLAELYDEEI